MGEGDVLQVVADPGEVGESLVAEGPVGEHARQGGEDVERRGDGVAAGVGSEEGRHHDVGAVFVHGSVGGVEGSAVAHACRVLGSHVLLFHASLYHIQVVLEVFERLALVAVVGVATALEGGLDADGGHVEGSGLRRRVAGEHILDALCVIYCATGVEVNLQVGQRFQRGFDLNVFHAVGGGCIGEAVAVDEPVVLLGAVDVAVADETEGEVQSRRHQSSRLALSEHVAHIRLESRQAEGIGVAVADADVAQHHQESCSGLCPLVPLLVFHLWQRDDVHSQLLLQRRGVLRDVFCGFLLSFPPGSRLGGRGVGGRGVCCDGVSCCQQRVWQFVLLLFLALQVAQFLWRHDAYGVLVHALVLDVVGLAVLVLSGDAYALALLSVFDDDSGVCVEHHLAGESLELLVLLSAFSFGVGLRSGVGVVQCLQCRGVSCCGFLLSLCASLGRGFFLFLLGFLLLLLCLVLLLRLALDGGGGEALVGILQELGVVVQSLEVQSSVDVHGALGVDAVAECASVVEFGSSFPAVLRLVAAVGLNPVGQRQFFERNFVGQLCVLRVVQWCSESSYAVQDAVLPCAVVVVVEVLVDGRVRFLDFGLRSALEGEVQCLGEIPSEVELSVPEERGCPADGDGRRRLEVLHVALLDFVVGADDVGVEGEALRREVEVLCLQQIQPLGLRLDVLEWFPCLPVGCPAVVQSSSPRLLVLVHGGLAAGVGVAVAVVEGEVCGVVGHGVLSALYVDLDASE